MIKQTFPIYDVSSLSGFKREDFLISRFAPYLSIHENLREAHKHSFYHVMLFTEGTGKHTIDFQTFPVRPYQMYFMIPGQVHSWQFEGHVDGYVLNFSVSFLDTLLLKPDYLEQFPFFNGAISETVIELPGQLRHRIVQLFESLVHESEVPELLAIDMVQTLMLQIFILVGRLSIGNTSSVVNSYSYLLLKKFQKLIGQHYKSLRLPKDYAECMFITPNHLNALCKNALGLSAGEVIRNRITLEAKRLLTNKALSIAEISCQLNFTDNSYFSKFYKKHTGFTPEEFRKQH
ncbi:helix-turn-helix domain-containing protein [Pedobacter hartonius]|uniref:Transcriptional regulator, AraC family n=1 Tax=Pedobacter hartonius TaxID=425514 RepID=A0A1H4GJG5_9SPHI|nr:helix-turn-helix domain-containing protein [Pedobacter hartonius]SEB09746.1 transcriptional regulator, AraC family [Pedobacter hartonius]